MMSEYNRNQRQNTPLSDSDEKYDYQALIIVNLYILMAYP